MTMVHIEHEIGRYMILCEGHSADQKCCNYITGVMYAFGGYVKNMEAEGECEVYGFEIDDGAPRFLIHCGGDERIEAAFLAAASGSSSLRPRGRTRFTSASKKIKNFFSPVVRRRKPHVTL